MTERTGSRRHVLILGGGYGGLSVARTLARSDHADLEVTVVDTEDATTFRTELYDVARLARADGDPRSFMVPFSQMALSRRGVNQVRGRAEGIDLDLRTVTIDGRRLPYDALVLAVGNVPAYYGISGCEENSEQVYTVEGMQRLASRLALLLRRGRGHPPPQVVIAGGGATGVELAADLASTDWEATLGPGTLSPTLTILTGPAPFLAGLPAPLIARARRDIESLGVVIKEGARVVSVAPGRITTQDPAPVLCDLFVWAGGLQAPAWVKGLPVPLGPGGRPRVSPYLEIYGRPGVFAVGDVATVTDPLHGDLVPSTAQAALEEGPVAAANLLARLYGGRFQIFRFESTNVAVAVGRGRAVATIGKRTVGGRAAGVIKEYVDREYHARVRGGTFW